MVKLVVPNGAPLQILAGPGQFSEEPTATVSGPRNTVDPFGENHVMFTDPLKLSAKTLAGEKNTTNPSSQLRPTIRRNISFPFFVHMDRLLNAVSVSVPTPITPA